MITRLEVFALIIFLFVAPSWAFEVSLKPEVLRQGDVLLIRATVPEEPKSYETLVGSFMDKKLIFFKTESGRYMALAGIDMKTPPGEYVITLSYKNETIFEDNIKILPASFGEQRLTLPKKMVDLTPKMLKRVKMEQTRLAKLWPIINEKIWTGRFIMPINGSINSPFGLRRIINNAEKSPHSGIDIEADEHESVSAPNSGRVALIDEQYLGGKTLVLDHGYGIYSVFFHLSMISVSEGQLVNKGDRIGNAGKTGRVTGAHLHWGVRLQGERIDPISLINLEMD